MRDFNRELDTGHAKIKTFPVANSKEFSHYVLPSWEDGNVAILHFGVSRKLQNRNCSKVVDDLILSLKKAATKCMSFGVSKVRVYGIVFNKGVAN